MNEVVSDHCVYKHYLGNSENEAEKDIQAFGGVEHCMNSTTSV